MMRNIYIFLFGLGILIFGSCAKAQDTGGHIILDLVDDGQEELNENQSFWTASNLISTGVSYIDDVKNYNELLEGDDIKKDFSRDIQAKYPKYNKDAVKLWEKSVRNGVRGYRLYEQVKKKVVDWFMNQELPIVVADNQYEMGEDEQYIETEKPIVIKKFKKVVAYSSDKKDRLAVKERRAKLNNLTPPSQTIKKYKKALMEKDWKTLVGFDWHEFMREKYPEPESMSKSHDNLLRGQILSRYTGVDATGIIKGAIILKPKDKGFMLLRDYQKYHGLEVDFTESENVKDVEIGFIWPQSVRIKDAGSILGYSSDLPIYFRANAIEPQKKVILRANVSTSVCLDKICLPEKISLVMHLMPVSKMEQTAFASYVMTIEKNIPRQGNEKYYDFKDLVWETGKAGEGGSLRLRVRTDDSAYFNVIMLRKEAMNFSEPSIQLEGKDVVVRFRALDKTYNALGKSFTFWVMTTSVNQYIKTMTAEPVSVIDVVGGRMSLGIIFLAFLGGMLLNFMPCVFPVLSLKLLSFTKFGGQNEKRVRINFMYNSLGILTSFLFIAMGLSILKLSGQAIGWGMQFQNIYFLIAIIWVVTLFLAHIFGFINMGIPEFANKFLDKYNHKEKAFEFFSGVFLVLLSTPCMAPYLGTAFGVALTGTVADIWLVVIAVGLGVSLPYVLISCFPKIAVYMPKPGKWLDFINLMMVLMLIVTIGWLVSVLAAQSATKEIWHWILYILAVLFILFFRHLLKIEVDKLDEHRELIPRLHRRFDIFFGVVLLGIFIFSGWDVVSAAKQRQQLIQDTKFSMIDEQEIRNAVDQGHKVLVKVGADWCLTCKYNDAFVFEATSIVELLEKHQVAVYEVDWTHYDSQVLHFMQKYGRAGLPFYVLFSPKFSEGIVLPELPDVYELETLLEM